MSSLPPDRFPLFSKLPFELRRQIWSEALAPQLDRVYFFLLMSSAEDSPPNMCPTMTRAVYAQSTTLTRIFSSVSRESRQVTHELLPDTLEFREKPRGHVGPQSWLQPLVVKFPAPEDELPRTLRFNGARDHIEMLVGGPSDSLEPALAGGPFERFAGVRHLSLGTNGFVGLHFMQALVKAVCPCLEPECEVHCKNDPVPGLLRMFPDLEAVYTLCPPLYDPDKCSCTDEEGKPVSHNWPRLDTANPRWSHYVVTWDGVCPDLKPSPEIHKFNELFPKVDLPHHKAFGKVKFRYLRPVQAELEGSLRRRLSIGGIGVEEL